MVKRVFFMAVYFTLLRLGCPVWKKGPPEGGAFLYLPRVAPPPLELPPPRLAPPPELIPPPENPPPLLRLAPPPELMLPEDRLLELEELLRLLTLPEDRIKVKKPGEELYRMYRALRKK